MGQAPSEGWWGNCRLGELSLKPGAGQGELALSFLLMFYWLHAQLGIRVKQGYELCVAWERELLGDRTRWGGGSSCFLEAGGSEC